jgi:hypothetical protein
MDEMIFFQKNALLNNLCGEWKNKWKACKNNKEKLVRLSLMQQSIPFFASYCYNGSGLSKDYILGEFHDYINGVVHYDCDNVKGYSYRLYVGWVKHSIREQSDVTHFMWSNAPLYVIEKYKCPTLYISNKSKVCVSCDGYNYVRVYLFDESELGIDDLDEESVVIVYKYSDKCKVTQGKYCLGRVNEFDKQLRL